MEALSRDLDEGLGPDGRRVMYLHMLPHKRLLLRFNNAGVPAWEAAALRALWPLAVRWARRELAMAPEQLADDERRVRGAFDAVAKRLEDGRPHLCGERFTAADLTFASLAASVVLPREYGVRLPDPDELPEPAARAVREFRAHPAGEYALELFREQRPR